MYDKDLEEDYVGMYKRVHSEPEWNPKKKIYGYGDGKCVYDRWKHIRHAFTGLKIESLLDFGAGKAAHHFHLNMYEDKFNITDVTLYDPAIPEYCTLSDDTYDAVICADVMEHIPEDNVDHVIEQVNSRANKVAFYVISANLTSTVLPNGENAHITRMPASWWKEKIMKHAKEGAKYYLMHTWKRSESFYYVNDNVRLTRA